MASHRNRFDLPRRPPEAVRLQLRQEAGFGCVVCGLAIAAYEHIEPEFKDAETHDPAKMAYLCEGCHGRVTRRFWSKDVVWKAKENPFCRRTGRCSDAFDITGDNVQIEIGTNKVVNIERLLVVDGETVLGIRPPSGLGEPYQLTGRFHDPTGEPLFQIIDNEWFGESDCWDISCVGGRITVFSSPGKIALQIHCTPPDGLTFERLDMVYRNTRIQITGGYLRVDGPDGGTVIVAGRAIVGSDPSDATVFDIRTDGGHSSSSGSLTIGKLGIGSIRIGGGDGAFSMAALPTPVFADTPEDREIASLWGKILLAAPYK